MENNRNSVVKGVAALQQMVLVEAQTLQFFSLGMEKGKGVGGWGGAFCPRPPLKSLKLFGLYCKAAEGLTLFN